MNARNRKHVLARRARQRGAMREIFDPAEVYERDDWVCQICRTAIDRSAKARTPLSASLDHIIPLSRGGEHSRANTQCAHLRCNVKKGTRVPVT